MSESAASIDIKHIGEVSLTWCNVGLMLCVCKLWQKETVPSTHYLALSGIKYERLL